MAAKDATASFSPFRIYNEEIRIVGSMAILHSFERAREIVGAGAIDGDALITFWIMPTSRSIPCPSTCGVRERPRAGYVKTEMAPVDNPRFKPHWLDEPPMQRYALPEELGPSLISLASGASSLMTGSAVVVDGGHTLW